MAKILLICAFFLFGVACVWLILVGTPLTALDNLLKPLSFSDALLLVFLFGVFLTVAAFVSLAVRDRQVISLNRLIEQFAMAVRADRMVNLPVAGGVVQRSLASSANAVLAQRDDLRRELASDDRVADAQAILERNQLASLMTELNQSVIVCNASGRVLLFNQQAGDQQSAVFGQTCFEAGQAKNTYGTGCFMLMHTGAKGLSSNNGLLTTRLAQSGQQPSFALEGSVFMGGAVVQWLRDGLGAINSSADVQALAASVPDSGGVVMVPAFTGLGAPYWLPDAQGSITGLSRGTTMAHIARAALESIALQSTALLQAMSKDAQSHGGQAVTELRVDGGACVNDLLMQMQADLAGVAVVRPRVVETTALGAAYLAGLRVGVYQDLAQLSSQWRVERVFTPQWSRDQALKKMAQWERAVAALPG